MFTFKRRIFAGCFTSAAIVLTFTFIGNPIARAQLSPLNATSSKHPKQIVNANDDPVQLKGVNLGGLFVMEGWMTPMTSDKTTYPDMFSVMQELDSRFGVSGTQSEQALITTYQSNWITSTDLQNIANAGYNAVRVGVWWGNFFPLAAANMTSETKIENSFRSDAWDQLDRIVKACSSAGLYVIIDMHGVMGGQSKSQDTGWANQNNYWGSTLDQDVTTWLWQRLAAHWNGNTTIAGFDLVNEPFGGSSAEVISAYNTLYNAVRAKDPNRMIFLEETFGKWNWDSLPDPSTEGWTNVVYENHQYGKAANVPTTTDNEVAHYNTYVATQYKIPGYIGEYNDYGTVTCGSSGNENCWQYTQDAYNNNTPPLSWTMWSYKSSEGALNAQDSWWGWYDPLIAPPPPTHPDIANDPYATILADWGTPIQTSDSSVWGENDTICMNPMCN